MEEEVYKSVPNYEGYYEISNYGQVRGVERIISTPHQQRKLKSMVLKQRINRYGYLIIDLSKSSVSKTFEVHRLIALTFLPQQEGRNCVNHMDADKLNNNVENLEWVTPRENNLHAIKHGLVSSCKRVINICTGIAYNSISEAAIETEIPYSKLKRIFCRGQENDTCLRLAI